MIRIANFMCVRSTAGTRAETQDISSCSLGYSTDTARKEKFDDVGLIDGSSSRLEES